MGRGLRLRLRAAVRACGVLPLLLSGCGSSEPEPDATAFVGEFAYAEGSRVSATCSGTRVTRYINGMQADVVPTAGGLSLISGPRCSIPLTMAGETARSRPEAPCDLSVSLTVIAAVFSSLTLRAEAELVHLEGAGRADLVVPDDADLTCEEFLLSATLIRRSE